MPGDGGEVGGGSAGPADPDVDAAMVPRCDRRSFRAELTPTWLATATVLAGHRPPDVHGPMRVAHVGSASGVNPAVTAAVHPDAEVWAWDTDPVAVEATRRLRDGAELPNLEVHERPGHPTGLGDGPQDLVVLDGVLDAVSDDDRAAVLAAVAASLRPGGLLCVGYRTTVGWSEVAPVVQLLRAAVIRDPQPAVDAARDVLALMEELRAGGAGYLTRRPVVATWLDEVLEVPPAQVVADYVDRGLRPLSHAQVVAMGASLGCTFIGSARLDSMGDVPPDLLATIGEARAPVLRRSIADLVLRPTHRCDLLRLGTAPMEPRERTRAVGGIQLVSVRDGVAPGAPEDAADRLLAGGRAVADLGIAAGHRADVVRALLRSGQAHPVAPAGGTADPSPSHRLSTVLGRPPTPVADRLVVTPRIGSAVPTSAELSRQRLDELGVG